MGRHRRLGLHMLTHYIRVMLCAYCLHPTHVPPYSRPPLRTASGTPCTLELPRCTTITCFELRAHLPLAVHVFFTQESASCHHTTPSSMFFAAPHDHCIVRNLPSLYVYRTTLHLSPSTTHITVPSILFCFLTLSPRSRVATPVPNESHSCFFGCHQTTVSLAAVGADVSYSALRPHGTTALVFAIVLAYSRAAPPVSAALVIAFLILKGPHCLLLCPSGTDLTISR